MDLGVAREGTFVTPARAPVVAVSSEQPFVLHEVCEGDVCALRSDDLVGLSQGSSVLLTSTGDYAIAIDEGLATVRSYEIRNTPDAEGRTVFTKEAIARDRDTPRYLVAGMRGSDYVITRTEDGRLGSYLPGWTKTKPIGGDIDNLLVVAVGESNLVARQIHSGGTESLYLVPVPVDSDMRIGDPILLTTGPTFSRVLLTPGDEHVVATSGSGDTARTSVFSVATGGKVDSFPGAVVSGRKAGEELPGLRGVSPDGSHVVYRHPTGALAMRDLDIQGSCSVRSSTAGDHRVAGFAPNGVLYMEASEGLGKARIFAFDPITQGLAAMSEAESGLHLAAVAAQMPGQPEDGIDQGRESMMHWAVAVRRGNYSAVSTHSDAIGLGTRDVAFMARDDGAVWLLDTANDGGKRTLAVRRIAPQVQGQSLHFERASESGPAWMDGDVEQTEFVQDITGVSNICASTGIPGAWAVRCSHGGGTSYLASDSGQTEDDPEQLPQPQADEPPAG